MIQVKNYEGIIKEISDEELVISEENFDVVIEKVNYNNFKIDDCQVLKVISKQKY